MDIGNSRTDEIRQKKKAEITHKKRILQGFSHSKTVLSSQRIKEDKGAISNQSAPNQSD